MNETQKMAEAVVEDNLDPVPNFVPSPEVRASIQIQLIGHTQVVGAEQNQEDLRLYFLSLRPENILTLQLKSHPAGGDKISN